MSGERIVAVAVRLGDLVVSMPPPARHHHVVHATYGLTGSPVGGRDQGFLTSKGMFVDRRTAWRIAVREGQVVNAILAAPETLFSEHLW